VREIGLGEAQQRLDSSVVSSNQQTVDHADSGWWIRKRGDDDQLVGVGHDRSLVRVVVIGRTRSTVLRSSTPTMRAKAALRAGRVADDRT
jgi:hypothetical protein